MLRWEGLRTGLIANETGSVSCLMCLMLKISAACTGNVPWEIDRREDLHLLIVIR
jgi:hypothetical protein